VSERVEKVTHRNGGAPWSKCNARTLMDFVHGHCTRLPDKPVLLYEDGLEVKRAELLELIERFAAYLAGKVVRGDSVAIMIGNRTEYFIALLATVANRAVLVSISPEAKEHDAGHVLRDSNAVVAIVEEATGPVVEKLRAVCPKLREVICLSAAEPTGLLHCRGERERLLLTDTRCERDDITVIYYTSGTTGAPKGCMLHHGWWLRIIDIDLRMNPDGRERGFCSVPFYYADPALYMCYALQVGGSVVVMRKFSVSRYWDVVHDKGVTQIRAIASIPVLLLKAPPRPIERAHRVHHAICAAMPHNMHRQLVDRFGVPWLDNYGSTEAGQMCRMPIEQGEAMIGSGSFGVPDPEVDIRVVDDDGRDVPFGSPGEILICGPEMFRGYLNRPDATADALRDGWYYTGDRGCLDARGFGYFLGRKKDIVRRSGENIAAAEVEAVLRLHPKVLDAAVIPVADDIRGEEVKAYVQLVGGTLPESVSPQSIAAFCAEKLAPFKVPRFIEYRLTDFPRTPSMRIQKEQLKKEREDLRAGAWDRESN
jgi:crotonobetaine/carnitine-CoA ligase